MTITIENLISAACSHVEQLASPVLGQKIFLISDSKEAKLIYDLLIVYGYEAKLYNENGAAKLYVLQSKTKKIPANQTLLAEALAYAHSLKMLKEQIDTISHNPAIQSSGYSIGFSFTPSLDKQITINLVSANKERSITAANQPAQKASSVSPAQNTTKNSRQATEDDIFSGPQIMRQPGLHKSSMMKNDGPDSLWKQFKLYMRGNSMAAGLTLIACFLGLIVLISLFVVSKAFLCPDFASMKDEKPPWYCSYKTDEKEK